MVVPTLEDSHGTGNSVINAPGKAMNGLFEHSVCPCQEVGNAYATQPSRNAAWAARFPHSCSFPLNLPTTNGPNPEERARGDTRSLASRVYPGLPGWLVQIVERKDTSNTQAGSMEAGFGPRRVCMVASIHSGPGRVLGPRSIGIGCQ